MRKGSAMRAVLMAGVSIGSIQLAACAAQTPVVHTVRVCDPQTDTTCHPTPNTKVVVK